MSAEARALRERREWITAWQAEVESSRDFFLLPLPDIPSWVGSGHTLVAACAKCGALVVELETHRSWHAALRERTLTDAEREQRQP